MCGWHWALFITGTFLDGVLGIENGLFLLGVVAWRRKGPKPTENLQFWSVLMKNVLFHQIFDKKNCRFSHISLRHITDSRLQPMHRSFIFLQSQVFTSSFRAKWCDLQRNASSSKEGPPKASATRRSPRRLVCRLTTKRWLQRLRSQGGMVPHSVGRSRDEEAGLCLTAFHLSSHISRIACDLCVFSGVNVTEHLIIIGTSACRINDR